MPFAYPSQRLQDWLSQQYCVCTGRRVDPQSIEWLMGPYGNVDVIEDRYIEQLARSEGLTVRKNEPGFGLIESFDELEFSPEDRARLRPEIAAFYENTFHYDLEVWSEWCQAYRPFAGALSRLYSRRLQQLNLPMSPLETSRGIRSQIYKLFDSAGKPKHTIWYRHLKSTKEVIYSGVYSHCRIPDGRVCMKVVFPLPRGNATVVMGVSVGEDGSLLLQSKGKEFGDPGFYFLLVDGKGNHHARYLPSFHESIHVYVDEEEVLRADHVLCLWRTKALHLHYRMNENRQ